MVKYKRILLKLSGEALAGEDHYGINASTLEEFGKEILELTNDGVQVGIVVGGGNIFRGLTGTSKGIERTKGDSMGMLATTINAIAIQRESQSANVHIDGTLRRKIFKKPRHSRIRKRTRGNFLRRNR